MGVGGGQGLDIVGGGGQGEPNSSQPHDVVTTSH